MLGFSNTYWVLRIQLHGHTAPPNEKIIAMSINDVNCLQALPRYYRYDYKLHRGVGTIDVSGINEERENNLPAQRMALPNDLAKTTQEHLQSLISEGTSEGPHLDFKRELPAAWHEKAKHDLTSDISAFANAGGGTLIFGVEQDDDGLAKELKPQTFNPDSDAMRLESILRDCVEPRMPGVLVLPVPVNVDGTKGYIILVHVPQSWVGPHRVTSNFNFFVREGRQSRPVNVPELRTLFHLSASVAQRVRDFRTERIDKILAGETPRQLKPGVVALLHLVPTQAALGNVAINFREYDFRHPNGRNIPIMGAYPGAGQPRVVLEGIAHTRGGVRGGCHGYSLLFRNGFFESTYVDSFADQRGDVTRVTSSTIEPECVRLMNWFREELTRLGVSTELMVMFSLLHAKRGVLDFRRDNFMLDEDEGYFVSQHVVLPEMVIAEDDDPSAGMQQVFDLLWQACNLPNSPYFDKDGQLVRR